MNAKPAWFITGTDTEVGKTLVSSAMLHALGKLDLRAAGMKPVAAGAEMRDGRLRNTDVDMLAVASTLPLSPEISAPYVLREPVAPHIAAALEGIEISAERLLGAYDLIATLADAVVVEGVGGFRVPLAKNFDSADLAQSLGLPVIMTVGLRLGCLSHALLTAEAIAARGLTLAGWVGNRMDPAMAQVEENIAALEERLQAPLLGVLPWLKQATPEAAASHLNFSLLADWPKALSEAHRN
jgi:dethiobiotin synthetase